ncbi:MAG TPA: Ppx/GppA phosphatase family protein [Sporichthyaceae bacterium]|jgi:exopolyphosphatase/guanosine-5'-triphosphate,3'-diphosphate pyrophosphatase|nr:Ppx/GppA phosphatase family protein [Sporichthyaceae bacterium]
MRLGVLDIGSNTIHLLVMDAHHGARPWATYSHKTELRLTEHLRSDGKLARRGVAELVRDVARAQRIAEDTGAEEMLAFATSAIRDATNVDAVLEEVLRKTGVELAVLTGDDEARLTFLAARRWCGWSAGRLLVLDIGGGSLEMAVGVDEEPETAVSLPLGAARLTRSAMPGDPPDLEVVEAVRRRVQADVAKVVPELLAAGPVDRVMATSKTFKQLARIAGAAPSSDGRYVRRLLSRVDLGYWTAKLSRMTVAERAGLPGVSPGRAHQLLAGAIVAEAAMEEFGLAEVEICPWALREGVILRRLDWIFDSQI